MHVLFVAALLYCSSIFAQESTPPETTAIKAPESASSTAEETKSLEKSAAVKKLDLLGKVSKIYKDSNRVIVSLNSAVKAEDVPKTWEFTNSKNESCEGKTLQSQDNNILVDFSGCANFYQIFSGTIISPALFQNIAQLEEPKALAPPSVSPPQPSPQAEPSPETKIAETDAKRESRWKFPRISVALGSSGADKFKFDSVSYRTSTQSASGSITFGVEPAAQISLLVMKAPQFHWGFQGGYTLESKRYVKSAIETVNGVTAETNYASPRPSVRFQILEMNLLYRWDIVYLPFGLNFSIAEFNKGPQVSTTITCTGSFGTQLGIGFIAGEHWYFEILYQQVSANVLISNSTLSADLGNGTLGGAVLRAGLIF